MARFGTHAPTSVIALLTLALLAGCSALGGGDTGLRDELATSRAQAELEHQRVEALERRLAELEVRSQPRPTRMESRLESRIERLVEQNERMFAASQSCQPAAATPPSSASFDDSPTDADQMKQLEQRLRAYSLGRMGGLSLEQREAMRLLLRKDRVLDGHDPWRQ